MNLRGSRRGDVSGGGGPGSGTAGRVRRRRRALRDRRGRAVDGLAVDWLSWDRPAAANAFTTAMLEDMIEAFRGSARDRSVTAVVLTGTGDRAFCSGADLGELAERYARRPWAYARFLGLFCELVEEILRCDKPVVNRVNGARIAGGQALGLACDFAVAADTAVFGHVGPRRGSAPILGGTEFLDLYVGWGRAVEALTIGAPWSAYKAYRLGLVQRVVPVYRKGNRFLPNPCVITERWGDPDGTIVYGEFRQGEDRARAEALLEDCVIDLSPLDAAVEALCTELAYTWPGCLRRTLDALRQKKREVWSRHHRAHRDWLALNIRGEGAAGARAFVERPGGLREVDFLEQRLREVSRGEPARRSSKGSVRSEGDRKRAGSPVAHGDGSL